MHRETHEEIVNASKELSANHQPLEVEGVNPAQLLPEGEEWFVLTVDKKEVRISARDKSHLIAKLKTMYPGAKIDTHKSLGRSVSGKKPNYWERKRLGGGVDPQPNMTKKKATQRNQQQQKKAGKK